MRFFRTPARRGRCAPTDALAKGIRGQHFVRTRPRQIGAEVTWVDEQQFDPEAGRPPEPVFLEDPFQCKLGCRIGAEIRE